MDLNGKNFNVEHHFLKSDASFEEKNVNSTDASLVYTQNNAPALIHGGFSDPNFFKSDNFYTDSNGAITIIDEVTGEVFVTRKKMNARAERWLLKSVVNKLMPKSRTSKCHRWKIPTHKPTIYRKVDDCGAKAFYGGLEVCANVWSCPLCAAKISERRRNELKQAIDEAKKQNLFVSMLTLTVPHYKSSDLVDLLNKMTAAYTKFWKDKAGKRLISSYGIVGRIRAFEVTYGENGFHPHFHVLLFCDRFSDPLSMQIAFFDVWRHCCKSKGLGDPNLSHGVHLDVADDAISDYVAKWGLESEMTKGHLKRSKVGYSMMDLLRAYFLTDDEKYAKLWLIYAQAFKGRRQLLWSNGLKDRLLVVDQNDEELATAQIEEAEMFAELSSEEWKAIYKTNSEHYVLNCVETDPNNFDAFLRSIIRLFEEMDAENGGQSGRIPADGWPTFSASISKKTL